MAQVLIRNVDDDVLARLKARAAERRMPIESLLREIVTRAAGLTPNETIELLRRIQAGSKPLPPGAPTAGELIREDRDTR